MWFSNSGSRIGIFDIKKTPKNGVPRFSKIFGDPMALIHVTCIDWSSQAMAVNLQTTRRWNLGSWNKLISIQAAFVLLATLSSILVLAYIDYRRW